MTFTERFVAAYERYKLYVANPCDFGAHPKLKALGQAIATVASDCKCCSGARALVLAGVAALWPPTLLFVIGYILFRWALEARA